MSKYKAGDKLQTGIYDWVNKTTRIIDVMVLSEPKPGVYNCLTDMGIAMLVPEADLQSP